MKRVKPELLSPAGDRERLEAGRGLWRGRGVFGGQKFRDALRPQPTLGKRSCGDAVAYCHARGVKVYVTCNTLPRNDEFEELPGFLSTCQEIGVDAFIISDLGVLALAKQVAPQVERHVSTQTGIVNFAAAQVCWELGGQAGGPGKGGAPVRDPRHPGAGGSPAGAGSLCPWGHVYVLFRPVRHLQLYDRPGCQPGRVRPALSLGVPFDGNPSVRGRCTPWSRRRRAPISSTPTTCG